MKSIPQKSQNEAQSDLLNHALDAALAKYSSVEPRAGLEERILAGLQSERDRMPTHAWWRWSAVGIVAAVIVFALVLTWKAKQPARTVAQHLSAPSTIVGPSPTQVAAIGEAHRIPDVRARYKAARHQVHLPVATAAPKLDQFPSPRPLTREELALVRYVKEFPRDAVTIASAQEEFEKEIQQGSAAKWQGTSDPIEEER